MARRKDYLDSIFEIADAIEQRRAKAGQSINSSDESEVSVARPKAVRTLRVLEGRKDAGAIPGDIPDIGTSRNDISQGGIPPNDISPPTTSITLMAPTKGFVKVYNWLFDELPAYLSYIEWIIYMHLYRLSVGFNSESCTIGYGGLSKRTHLARNAVIKAIKGLIAKGYLQANGQSQDGTTFKLTIPHDGIPQNGIPLNGIPQGGIPRDSTPGIPRDGIPQDGIPSQTPEESTKIPAIPRHGIPPEVPNKDNIIKDIYKNNNKERLLLFFSNTPFEPITPEALDWLSQYDYDTVTQYAREVLAWPGTKNHMALLRAALANGYKFSNSGRDPARDSEIKAIIEQQARQAEAEEQAFKEFKNNLQDEEREKIVARARESLQSDPFYRVIQSEEIKAKYLDGKIEAELRKEFEERRACINPVS